MKIVWVASHAIQYQVSMFRALSKICELEVWYLHHQKAEQQAKAGYGVAFDWDIDLHSGYQFIYLQSALKSPNVENFFATKIRHIDQYLLAAKPDRVVVGGWYLRGFWQVINACARRNIPIYAVTDSISSKSSNSLLAALKKIVRRLKLRRLSGFLSAGLRADRYLREQKIPERKIHRLQHSVDTAHFKRMSTDPPNEVQTKTILFVGSLLEKKGVFDLLKACASLPAEFKWTLFVVGDGPARHVLEKDAHERQLPVHFVGFVNQLDLPIWYNRADLLVFPSHADTWGLVVNEAIACETPVLISDAAGCSDDLLQFGPGCRIFRAHDPVELAAKIMTSPSEVQARESLSVARDFYGPERAAQQVLKILSHG